LRCTRASARTFRYLRSASSTVARVGLTSLVTSDSAAVGHTSFCSNTRATFLVVGVPALSREMNTPPSPCSCSSSSRTSSPRYMPLIIFSNLPTVTPTSAWVCVRGMEGGMVWQTRHTAAGR